MPSKVWDEITYSFLNFNGATVTLTSCVGGVGVVGGTPLEFVMFFVMFVPYDVFTNLGIFVLQ